MRVLLVSPNIESLPDPVFPLGLAYIAASLKKNGIEHRVLDLGFVEDYENALESTLSSFKPDFIGLSLRNIDNVSYPDYVSYLPFYRQVVERIRRETRASIILGGSGFSLMPDALVEYLGADFGIIGEGELSFVRLIKRLSEEGDCGGGKNSPIIGYGPEIIDNLDRLPIPDRSGFDNEAYLHRGGMGNIQTKRGCPFKCIYCTYPVIEGKKIRVRDPNGVCDEIEGILAQGITNLFFVDDSFTYPVDHAQALCREMIKRKLPVKWSCYANPGFVTPKLIELMISAGCTGVEFGSDAANQTMLNNMGKNFTVDDLRNASAVCRQSGIAFCHSLLLGGPGETMDTIHQTVDTVREMSPTAVICMIGIRVFPGTRMSLIALKEGMISPEQDFLRPVFYFSPAIEEKIFPFMEKFAKENPTWIFPGLTININQTLQKKLRRFGVKGPLWEHMKIGERFGKV